MAEPKILHVVITLSRHAGGPPRVVTALSDALERMGIRSTVLTSATHDGTDLAPLHGTVCQFPTSWLSRVWPAHGFGLSRLAARLVRDHDVVHIHELWHYPHYVTARLAARMQKPYLVSPHGALEPWAVSFKGWKKRLYMGLVQRRLLSEATVVHAETDAEATYIRNWVPGSSIQVIPNGVSLVEFSGIAPSQNLKAGYPGMDGKRIVLFMGRLHPKKGLDVLAQAFGLVAQEHDDVRLVIAGPDPSGYGEVVRQHLRRGGVTEKALFVGMLNNEERLAALSRADIFVLPSRSEGFSVAVLEAMAAGCPVVISPACYFPEVDQAGAGVTVTPKPKELAEVLCRLLSTPKLLSEMGGKGRALVREHYSWDRIAEAYAAMYEKALRSTSESTPRREK